MHYGLQPEIKFFMLSINIGILEHDLNYWFEHVKTAQMSIERQALIKYLHKYYHKLNVVN